MRFTHSVHRLPPLLLLVLGTGCGSTPTTAPEEQPRPGPSPLAFLVDRQPEDSRGVFEIKKEGQNGEEVVVAGRIGGPNPFVRGRAVFTIVDTTLEPSGVEGNANPWEFAEMDRVKLAQASLTVRVVDGNDETLLQDAREFFDLRPGQLVIVFGKLRREGGVTVSVIARSLFKEPRRVE
jgi:hypothetical protein